MGCITRLGCLFVLVVAGVIGWFTRDRWLPQLTDRLTHRPAAVATTERWEPLSDAGADSTRAALTKLSEPRGQVFQTLSPGAVASYIYREAVRRVPNAADSVEAMVNGDKLSMRAIVPLASLGGALGDAVGIVGDHERVQLTGTLRVLKPGLAEFDVAEARVHGLPLPKGMIANLIGRFQPGPRPAGIDPSALPLPIPRYIGDIRVANGKVTLYKTVQ
jgi:hypothetical protein